MSNNPNLTDNEKRDIIKYLESGKPLPGKYSFTSVIKSKALEHNINFNINIRRACSSETLVQER